MSEDLLRLEHLSIDYKVKGGYLSAVNDVNLKIKKGEILAIVGESGCGKSTVAHSIMNLLPGGNETVSGRIMFRGENLREFSWAEMEKSVKQRLWEAGEWARKAGLKEMSMEDKKA